MSETVKALRRRLEPLLRRVFHLYWRLVRGMTLGVRAVVLDADNRVFLVKHSYISGWYLPGGGVEVGESFAEALTRELLEEGCIELAGEPELHGLFFNSHVSRRDHVAVYIVRQFRQERMPKPNREIVACGFFEVGSLPDDTTPGTRLRITEVIEGRAPIETWRQSCASAAEETLATDEMKSAKLLCGLLCLLLLAGQLWSMSRWNEARGVYDDVCYLRQAHLFQRFGLKGFDTDISRDDDGYFADKLKEIGFATPGLPPCHTPMPAAGKLVIQYPPGTGFALALFPQGHQVIPLFGAATIIVAGFAVLGIFLAGSAQALASATVLGLLAIYIMINPSKASYSMAPTMVACAFAGYLTARLFAGDKPRERIWLAVALGLVLGLSVNFRLPNLFLSAGTFLFLAVSFLASRKFEIMLRGFCFGAAYLAGMAPTLIANAINAGSPFATTYSNVDVVAPELSLEIIRQYLTDMQFVLLALAAAAIAYVLAARGDSGVRRVALVTATNIVVNLAFFLSHPIFTPYYIVPIAMLSLWSVSFAALMKPAEVANEKLVGRAAGL